MVSLLYKSDIEAVNMTSICFISLFFIKKFYVFVCSVLIRIVIEYFFLRFTELIWSDMFQ